MFRFYLITAWRNLKKNRLVSIINITGLTVGLTCSVFAIYYALNELTYEDCHEKSDRIARIYTQGKFGPIEKLPNSFGPTANELQSKFPEIETASVTRTVSGIVYKETQPFNQNDIVIADNEIYNILTINFLEGDKPQGAHEIAMSEKMAKKYFGHEQATGKFITISIWGRKFEYHITGIFKDLPNNTHLKISGIIPIKISRQLGWNPDSYNNLAYNVFVLLQPGTDIQKLNLKIAEDYHMPVDIENIRVELIPIKRIHLHESISENNLSNLIIILIGGIVALILSCFSYINLTSILFSMRRHEVGIKKVNGGASKDILAQFITDTGLTTLISLVLAFVIFYYLLPQFNTLMDRQLTLKFTFPVIVSALGVFILTVLLSGLLPAWSLSRHKPVQLIRKEDSNRQPGRVKNSLLTIQFIVAIILLQFFIISRRQGEYMFRSEVCGYNTDNVITINGYQWGDLSVIKDELLKNSAIEYVSWSDGLPAIFFNMTNSWKEEGNKEMATLMSCAGNYTDVFRIRMKDGRFFSDEFSGEKNSVVINSLMAHSLGMQNPVGKPMLLNNRLYIIIGVVDDFQSVPVIFDEMPLIMNYEDLQSEFLLIRVNENRRKEAQTYITSVLRNANPDYPIELKYYIDYASEAGKSFIATNTLMDIFTLIIIVNAMMGLFGLSFFIAQHKNKEVGIRKVCGASVKDMIWRLSKGFTSKLVIALAIATPITYFAGQQFVSTFTNHIAMTPDLFLIGGILALLMVALASGWKIAYAASRNPVEGLRYE